VCLRGAALLQSSASASASLTYSPSGTATYTKTETPTGTYSPSGTGSHTITGTPSRTGTHSASVTASPSGTETACPSPSYSRTPTHTRTATATPLVCSSTDFKPVTIISNLNNSCVKNHTLPVNGTLPVWGSTPWFNHTANHTFIGHHTISSDIFGGVVLTDQQRIAITFTSPCSAPPCSFTLTALTLCLKNLPSYFLSPDAVAGVSFKVELGRYYTNVPPHLRARQLTFSSPSPNYAPYVDIQSTIWTPKIYVGPNVTCFTVPLAGLHYTLWAESAAVTPGDFKLIVTPYIHYDRTHAGVPQSVLDCTPEQIEWVLASPLNCTEPSSYFSHGTGFLMPPGCPQNVNGQLVTSNGGRASWQTVPGS